MQVMHLRTDILVIGGGLAGLSAALRANEAGCNVVIAAKGKIGKSGNTIMARNSIAAVTESEGQRDLINRHIKDTLAGGAFLNEKKLVKVLAENAKEAVNWLSGRGVPFLQDNGNYIVKGSPGHTEERVLTVDSHTVRSRKTPGLAITLSLLQEAREKGVEMLDNVLITSLIKKGEKITGACALDRSEERALIIEAKGVILACGGAGALYPFTTNTADVTGDGFALAYEAGAGLRDLEFIQFHPCVTLGSPRLVLSTAPFSDGAVLKNRYGEEYMYKYSPRGNMATRDVMARAGHTEIKQGRGTENNGVYLDFSGVGRDVMDLKYKDIKDYLKGENVIEVAPAAHFTMGGVIIDERCRTGIPGLYACGEAAGGVHGANRLAANALTEAVVFGLRAGESAALESKNIPAAKGLESKDLKMLEGKIGCEGFADRGHAVLSDSHNHYSGVKKKLRQLMGEYVSVVREKKGLKKALTELIRMYRQIDGNKPQSYRCLIDYHQTRMMLISAFLITEGALKREASIGAHYRSDSPCISPHR